MVDLAVYIATLTEAIVRPLLLVDKPPDPNDKPHTVVIDQSTVMQVEAFRWCVSGFFHSFISSRRG